MGFQLLRLNTNRVTLYGVEIGGSFLDGSVATFNVTSILDATNAPIGGETFPVAFTYVAGSEGEFFANIDAGAILTHDAQYTVVVDVQDGADRFAHWEMPAVAKTRDGIIVR